MRTIERLQILSFKTAFEIQGSIETMYADMETSINTPNLII